MVSARARRALGTSGLVALLLVTAASCGGQRRPFSSSRLVSLFEGSTSALIPAAGFAPDGQRLALSVVDVQRGTVALGVFERTGFGWRVTGVQDVTDAGWPTRAWLTDSSVVLGSLGVGAVVFRPVDGGWALTSTAPAHGELTGVSDDGLVLSSSQGVARWTGAAWVDESPIVGVVTGDGQRVVSASVDGGSLLGTGPNLTLTSYVARDGGWTVETSSTVRPFGDTPMLGAPLLEVSRDGALAAVRVQVPVTGQPLTTTVALLYARRDGVWALHSREAGPSVGGGGLSADGRVLVFGGASDLTQVRSVAGLGPPVGAALLRGTPLALGPDGDAVLVWRQVSKSAVFEVFDR